MINNAVSGVCSGCKRDTVFCNCTAKRVYEIEPDEFRRRAVEQNMREIYSTAAIATMPLREHLHGRQHIPSWIWDLRLD